MATRFLTRSLLTPTKETLSSLFVRSFTSLSLSKPPQILPASPLSILRFRPLVAVAASLRNNNNNISPAGGVRGFATRQTTSSLNDPNPNWSNRPPKETILLDGCDFEHWLVVVEKPDENMTRDDIIDSYIKTLAQVVGSEDEARMKIYSVSTRHYHAFGALVSEELSYKLKELPGVRWVLPDSYLDVRNKDYGGEPFINGQAVPYDPKYHEEWVRNNARANERNRRNDRPRTYDRSRNFDRRRDMQTRNPDAQMGNQNAEPNRGQGGPQNMGANNPGYMPPNNMGSGTTNMGGVQPNNMSNIPSNNMGGPPPSNYPGQQPSNYPGQQQPSNYPGQQPSNYPGQQYSNNMGQPSNYTGHQSSNNIGQPPANYMGGPPQSNYPGGMQHNNMGGIPNNSPNLPYGTAPYQSGPGQNQQTYAPNKAGGNTFHNE